MLQPSPSAFRNALRIRLVVSLASVLLCGTPGLAQFHLNKDQPDRTIDVATRTEVIEGVLRELNKAYVFPDVAKKMDQAVRVRLQNKEYDAITSGITLAETLTAHLRDVCHDKHLSVRYSAEVLPPMKQTEPTPEEREKMRAAIGSRNFSFEKVERLDGNIGLLVLHGFAPAELAGETAAAAMGFLAHTDALVIDLRKNGGGSPAMVALLCSYLFEPQPVHLNDLYNRASDTTHQWWTFPYVPGKRYVGKDVYVLTSKRTFSAAEEFTYNLKNLKRATIVGEVTGGGAHPVSGQRINDHFGVIVPVSRAINPISKTNWEGTGVKPDVEVPQELALNTAYLTALQKQLAKTKEKRQTDELRKMIRKVEGELAEGRKGK